MKKICTTQEEWKDVPGCNGHYQVSDLGRVKSLNYRHTGKEGILKPFEIRGGYLKVDIFKNGKKKPSILHRLVWEVFNGPIPEGLEVNHINEDKTDNRLENLNLMTPKENNNWGTRNERTAKALSKPLIQLTVDGEFVKEWPSAAEVQRQLGLWRVHIYECCKGKRKTAGGYKWRFKETETIDITPVPIAS